MILRLAVIIIVLSQSTFAFAFANEHWQDCSSEKQQALLKMGYIAAEITEALGQAGTVWEKACEAELAPGNAACFTELATIVASLNLAKTSLGQAGFFLDKANSILSLMIQAANDTNLGQAGAQVGLIGLTAFASADIKAKATYNSALQAVVRVHANLRSAHVTAHADPILKVVAGSKLLRMADLADMLNMGGLIPFQTCLFKNVDLITTMAALKFVADLGNGNGGGAPGGPFAPNGALGDDGAMGDGGYPGDGDASSGESSLSVHPTFAGEVEDLWVGQAQRVEEKGRVYRVFKVGYTLDAGAYLDEVLHPFTGEVLVPEGTPIVVVADFDDDWPAVEYNSFARRLEISGYGLPIHLEHAGMGPGGIPIHSICGDVVFDGGDGADIVSPGGGYLGTPVDLSTVNPGQYQRCTMRLETTGSPEEVALEEIAEKQLTILPMGGNSSGDGDGFFRHRIRVQALKEEPNDPCFVWDDYLGRYEYDPNACGPGEIPSYW